MTHSIKTFGLGGLVLLLGLAPSQAGIQPARVLAAGSTWGIVASPNVNKDFNELTAVASVAANDVWAVGDYRASNSQYQTLTEHWNGPRWSIVPSPDLGTSYNFLKGVTAISSSNVWAVGGGRSALVEHWNGAAWSVVPNPYNATNRAMLLAVAAISGQAALAMGYGRTSYCCVSPLAERWDGTSWTAVTPATADVQPAGIAALSATDAWAVGGQLPEHWNGTTWSAGNGSQTSGFLDAVTMVASNDAWAVGSSTQPVIEHWNGTTWSAVTSPSIGLQSGLAGVSAAPGGTVWAVGGYYPAPGAQEQTLILRTM